MSMRRVAEGTTFNKSREIHVEPCLLLHFQFQEQLFRPFPTITVININDIIVTLLVLAHIGGTETVESFKQHQWVIFHQSVIES